MSEEEKGSPVAKKLLFKSYQNYFKEKEICAFLEDFLSKNAIKILSDLNDYYSNFDMKSCLDLIKKINESHLFETFNKEQKISYLDFLIKKILPNIFYSPSNIISFLGKVRFLIPQNYKIDWKFFYTLYYLTYHNNQSDTNNFIYFYKSLHKFIPDDAITEKDYEIIRSTFINDLINNNKSYAIRIFIYFFPLKCINNDTKIQFQIFQLFKNSKKDFKACCCMFSKILMKNGTLNFSSNKKENTEYIKEFLKYYFTNLNLFIIDDNSVIDKNYSSPIFVDSEKNKSKGKSDKSIINVLINLLFNENLKEYNDCIENHLKLLLNNKHLYLKEKANEKIAKNYIQFLNDLIFRISSLFNTKKFDEKINKKFYTVKEYNPKTEYLYNRLLIIIKYFSISFKKLFLYENDGTFNSLQKLFSLISLLNAEKNYMQNLLDNMEFSDYLKIIEFLKENSETKMYKFITKLSTILPLLLNNYVYTNIKGVKSLMSDVVSFLPDCVSSVNISVDHGILMMFATYFFDLKNKNEETYENLILLVKDGAIKIMNNILYFLDLICLKNEAEFCIFIKSMKTFLDKESLNIISQKYANYIEENEIESKYLSFYFYVIDEEEHAKIFNYIYNNILYVDSSNNTKLNDFFIYPNKDEEMKINVSYCSLEITEKQVNKYKNLVKLLNFSKIFNKSSKNTKNFYQIYYSLINKEEQVFKRLGTDLFFYVINSLIECKINSENEDSILIEYPSREDIDLINKIIRKLIIPYEKYILDYMANNNMNNTDQKTIEQIIYIYLLLIKAVSSAKLNIIYLLNEQENPSLNEYEMIQNQINIYKDFNSNLSNSLEVIKKIFEYNQKSTDTKLFNNRYINSTFDETITAKLTMNSQTMTDEREKYKKEKNILFKYFHLNNFKKYWLINKIYTMNYNYFSLMKNFNPKDKYYYEFLYIHAQNYTSVNYSANCVSMCKHFIYALNNEKIKDIYSKIFFEYQKKLFTINDVSETGKTIMKNISETFIELSLDYISLYPYELFDVLKKIFVLFVLLKIKKYSNYQKIFGKILMISKSIFNLPLYSEIKFNFLYQKYSQRNEIIEEEFNNLKKLTDNTKKFNEKYNTNLIEIIDISIKGLSGSKNFITDLLNNVPKLDEINSELINKQNMNENEILLLFHKLKDYIFQLIDKKSDFYKIIIKTILDYIFSTNIPNSFKSMWIKVLYFFIKDEYKYYKEYIWSKFNNEEEYKSKWNTIKNEIKLNTNKISPIFTEKIRQGVFKYNEYLLNNLNYKIDAKYFMEIITEVSEWREEQKLIMKDGGNMRHQQFQFLLNMLNDKDVSGGISLIRTKLIYCLFELKYLNEEDDFIKTVNFNFKDNKKNNATIYEFILGKYLYLLNNNKFSDDAKNELWTIMQNFTNGTNKKEDENIYSFFSFLFKKCNLKKIELIFSNINFYQYPINFVSKLYNIVNKNVPNLKNEISIFDKSKTQDLISKIISTDENLILYSKYLSSILEIYYIQNGYLKYDYLSFSTIHTKDLINHFINEILPKDFSKHSRHTLYELYSYYFDYLNDEELTIFKDVIQKIALCIHEFKINAKEDPGNAILNRMEIDFRNYNHPLNFILLCNKICEIIKEEKNTNDTSKLLYLQVVNLVYKGQKHFNIDRYEKKEIFDCLVKVFDSLLNENLKTKFAAVFVSYFNDLTEEENEKFINEKQDIIFNFKDSNEDIMSSEYNYVFILMSQLLRFRMCLPEYIQKFIIRLKLIKKKNANIKKIVYHFMKSAMDYYHGSYIYMKRTLLPECKEVLEEMTIEKSYFV